MTHVLFLDLKILLMNQRLNSNISPIFPFLVFGRHPVLDVEEVIADTGKVRFPIFLDFLVWN